MIEHVRKRGELSPKKRRERSSLKQFTELNLNQLVFLLIVTICIVGKQVFDAFTRYAPTLVEINY